MIKTHKIKETDKGRIKCQRCGSPATVCEHDEWQVGSMRGISFWYYCGPCFALQLAGRQTQSVAA